MAKYSKGASKSVKSAMRRRKKGSLKSGSGGKVTSRQQAIAIGLSEAREKGAKVPAKKSASKKSAGRRAATKNAATKNSTGRKSPTKKSAGRRTRTSVKKSSVKKSSTRGRRSTKGAVKKGRRR